MDALSKELNIKIDRSKYNIELVVEHLKDDIESMMQRWNRFKTDKDLQNNQTLQQVQLMKNEITV